MTSSALAERYGTDRPWHGRAVVAGSVVVALVFAAWLTWTIADQTTPQVTSKFESFSVVDEHTATAAVIVELADRDVQATCTLRAYAADHSVVGEWRFAPDPDVRRQVEDFRTERRATAVESLGCTAPGQNRPR